MLVDGTGDSPFVEAGFMVIMLVAPGWFAVAGGGAGGPVVVVTAAAAFRALTSSLRESTMANRAGLFVLRSNKNSRMERHFQT